MAVSQQRITVSTSAVALNSASGAASGWRSLMRVRIPQIRAGRPSRLAPAIRWLRARRSRWSSIPAMCCMRSAAAPVTRSWPSCATACATTRLVLISPKVEIRRKEGLAGVHGPRHRTELMAPLRLPALTERMRSRLRGHCEDDRGPWRAKAVHPVHGREAAGVANYLQRIAEIAAPSPGP
jgi:hypothetical protein